MPLFNAAEGRPNSVAISCWSFEAGERNGIHTSVAGINPVSGAISNNILFGFPINIYEPYRIRNFFVVNGSTTIAGNIDMGVYDTSGTLLVSTGAIAQSGASALQLISADYTLQAGFYYAAFSCSSATATFFRYVSMGNPARMAGFVKVASGAHPLPSSVTFAASDLGTYPVFGITKRTTL